jgi:hypothetical protein
VSTVNCVLHKVILKSGVLIPMYDTLLPIGLCKYS